MPGEIAHNGAVAAPTILLVDDDTQFVEFLGSRLRRLGFNVVPALDGLQAGVQAQQRKPDLIIMDFQMPAASGDTVFQRLRMSTETLSIPVIVISSRTEAELKARIPQGPNVRVMTKPPDFDTLKAWIQELLGLPGLPLPGSGGATP